MAKDYTKTARFDEEVFIALIEFSEGKNWTPSQTIYEIVKSFFKCRQAQKSA